MSGPRLCALRIPNGSSNILLDNIESESKPVIYTRRSRFLDEELDEHKDIVTTQTYNYLLSDVTIDRRPRKISMLMSDGVKNTNSNSTIDLNAADNENEKTFFENYPNNTFNGIGMKPPNLSPANEFRHEKVYLGDEMTALNAAQEMIDETDIHNHDETTMLRRQQLSRVAEWVQNNSTLEENVADYSDSADASLCPTSDYKINIGRMNNGIGSCPIDRELKTLASINRINDNSVNMMMMMNANQKRIDRLSTESDRSMNANEISRNTFAQQTVAMNNLNNNCNSNYNDNQSDGKTSMSVEATVDLAQMEYNVKQFLLKQNEWSTTGNGSNGSMTASQLSSNTDSLRNPQRTETNL